MKYAILYNIALLSLDDIYISIYADFFLSYVHAFRLYPHLLLSHNLEANAVDLYFLQWRFDVYKTRNNFISHSECGSKGAVNHHFSLACTYKHWTYLYVLKYPRLSSLLRRQ